MAINFPSSPINDQEYTDPGSGTQWIYNSADKSWTMTSAGSSSPFNFRGGYDFTTANTIGAVASGDLFIHEGADGTVGTGYTGLSGQITAGTLVLWDGTEFIKLSSSVPGYPDIDDPNYQNGTLDSRYLSLAADAGAQVVQSTDETEFKGRTIHANGVRVTNSSSGGATLLLKSDTSFSINNEGSPAITMFDSSSNLGFYGGISGSTKVGGSNKEKARGFVFSATTKDSSESGTRPDQGIIAIGAQTSLEPGKTVENISCFFANTNNGVAASTVKNQYGYYASNTLSAAFNNYSFYTDLGEDSHQGGKAYAFYSSGNAPSYLQGSTYIGGNTTRNTLELWKSTLTEEQLEQLEAGTLVAPANVSLPGDGEFARQWYYDQQDAETQAELTAGTLEYPEHLAAATFTDTFALGNNTKINLLSSGKITSAISGPNSFIVDRNNSISPYVLIQRNGDNTSTERLFVLATADYPADKASDDSSDDGIFNISADGSIYSSGGSANYFGGLVESAGGVKVTGGNFTTIGAGMTYDSGNSRLTLASYNNRVIQSDEITFTVTGDRGRAGNNSYGISVTPEWKDSNRIYNVTSTIKSTNTFSPDAVFNYWAGNDTATITANNQYGYYAHSTLASRGTQNYGFYSDLATDGDKNYNFYAAGTAPNYFRGDVNISDTDVLDPTDTKSYTRLSADRILNQSYNVANDGYNAVFRRQTNGRYIYFGYYDGDQQNIGDISRVGDNLAIIGTQGGPLILDNGADARNVTSTEEIANATTVVQALKPVKINGTRLGFTAAEIPTAITADVVRGTADETLAIGTLADYDGTVLETAVVEPSAEELTYTEDVEVEGVSTATVRTRTWTATGTRPVYQGVDQTKLIPLLTKALQEALERIDALEAAATA